MRPVLASTGARLLSSRHPRQVTKIKAVKTLNNAVTHLSGKQQKLSNQMGDSFSKKVSLDIMENISKGHDREILEIKKSVESLYLGHMAGATPRLES